MTYELLLLRHAKSDWTVDTDDFSRPLKKRGRRDAKRVGRWLREQQLIPDKILSSPAERALTTAQRVCRQLGIAESAIVRDSRIYEAEPQTLLKILHECGEHRRVLLVGHNPGLEDLLRQLSEQPVPLTDDGKCMTTACVARLCFEGGWQDLAEGQAKLVTLMRPGNLPD